MGRAVWALGFLSVMIDAAGAMRQDDWRPLGEPVDARIYGVWQNQATGHVVRFSASGREVFHVLPGFCIEDNGVVPAYALYRLAAGGAELQLQHYDYRGRPELLQAPQVLERASVLPVGCLRSEDEVASKELIARVLQTFDQYYAFFQERGIDWVKHKRTAAERASAVADDSTAFELLVDVLTPINDAHVNLTLAGRTFNAGRPELRQRLAAAWKSSGDTVTEGRYVSNWHRSVLESVHPLLDGGSASTGAAGALEWGTIRSSIGYIRINRFSGFTQESVSRSVQFDSLAAAMERLRADLRNTTRLIVDVALNGGGSDAAALLVAGFFADVPRPVLAYEARGARKQVVNVSPPGEGEFRPIHLVTSEVTASAAESFVLMMRAFPHVTQVGDRTRGALSSLLPKPFPNGLLLTLSYQRVLDAGGNVYEGTGIPVECKLELFPDQNVRGEFARVLARLAADASLCRTAG